MGAPGSSQASFGSLGGGASTENQFMNFPSFVPGSGGSGQPTSTMLPDFFSPQSNPTAQSQPQVTPPGIVPPQGGQFNPPPPPKGGIGTGNKLQGGGMGERTLDPQLTNAFAQWLQSQLGTGMTPFDLSAILPSTGQATAPGTLTAPENPILQQLQQFYTNGTGGPLPGVLPMWNAEMQQMNIPIQQQLANIKEQFGARGALGSTEMATALEQYGSQTAADQEALLTQATQAALPGMTQFGEGLQQLDQNSINALYQEFQRTQPQNNPLLGMISGISTTFPPIYDTKGGASSGLLGSMGSLLGGAGAIGGSIAEGLSGGGGITDVLSSLAGMFI